MTIQRRDFLISSAAMATLALGGLTVCLLNQGHRVVAIERDRDMIPNLEQLTASAEGRLQVLEADAKTVDYAKVFADLPKPRVLTGNLPYNLTGPLLRISIELAAELQRAVFLVQREVADRLTAKPNSSNYGALSVFAQAAFSTHREFIVRRGAFYPQPGVDSAVVSLHPRRDAVPETPGFQRLVKAVGVLRAQFTIANRGQVDAG